MASSVEPTRSAKTIVAELPLGALHGVERRAAGGAEAGVVGRRSAAAWAQRGSWPDDTAASMAWAQAAWTGVGQRLAGPPTTGAGGWAELELIVTMRITVLGKSPSWQDAGGACSGYLIEDGGVSLLLDCGNGVFSKLRLFRDYTELDAVLVSHLHADHFLDLVPYAYALTYAPRQQPVPVARLSGHRQPGSARA